MPATCNYSIGDYCVSLVVDFFIQKIILCDDVSGKLSALTLSLPQTENATFT
jgi:hypothetical protein